MTCRHASSIVSYEKPPIFEARTYGVRGDCVTRLGNLSPFRWLLKPAATILAQSAKHFGNLLGNFWNRITILDFLAHRKLKIQLNSGPHTLCFYKGTWVIKQHFLFPAEGMTWKWIRLSSYKWFHPRSHDLILLSRRCSCKKKNDDFTFLICMHLQGNWVIEKIMSFMVWCYKQNVLLNIFVGRFLRVCNMIGKCPNIDFSCEKCLGNVWATF